MVGNNLNSGTEEEIRWRCAVDGGLEVKARPATGLLTWRLGHEAGTAMAERRVASLLEALLEMLECMLLAALPWGEAAAGVIRGSYSHALSGKELCLLLMTAKSVAA